MVALNPPNVPTFRPFTSTTQTSTVVSEATTSDTTTTTSTSILSLVVTQAPEVLSKFVTTAYNVFSETDIHNGPVPLPPNVTESPFAPDYTDTSDLSSTPAPYHTTSTTSPPMTTMRPSNCVELTAFDMFCQQVSELGDSRKLFI